jgi:citrate synthase
MSSESDIKKVSNVALGLEGVVASQTNLSLVDGANSKLYYRGIPVHELVENSTFEEVAYMLWYGHLPTKSELSAFDLDFKAKREIPADVVEFLKNVPKTAHPMGVLRTAVSILGNCDKDADNFDPEKSQQKALVLASQMATVIATFHRIREGKEIIAPDRTLSHAANFLMMMHGKKPLPEMEKTLDAYLILLADHGLNASTFSARVTTATQSDIYSAITSAVGTLKGDLHGSANQRAMEMILEIGSSDKAEEYVLNLLRNKQKVMGFGHRIYKKEDPRAKAFRKIAADMCEKAGDSNWMDISNIVEKVMLREKSIPCNVDFFSASVLYILGFPIDFFTTVFAASRIVGWTAHVIEQQRNNRLIRPSAEYTGPLDQHYVPIHERTTK